MTTSDTSSDKKQSLGERVRLFQTMQLPGQPQNTHMGTFQLVMDLYQELLWLRKREEAVVSVVDNMNADARHSIGYWVRQLDDALSIVRYTGKTEEQERDEAMVDNFAAAMKEKLAAKRAEGRGGWWDPAQCSAERLARMLVEHVAKGNDGSFVDVANFAAMLHQRGEQERTLRDVFVDEIDREFDLKHYENQYNNALAMIRMRGVPETRAKRLMQALDVLLTRLDREIMALRGECEQLAVQASQVKDERSSLIEENERLITELSEAKKEVTDAEAHSIEAWAKGWIEENGVPEVTHHEAIQATLRFVEGEVKPCGCDSESISGCWRCQMVYLANVVRELLDAKEKTAPPPPWPTTMDEVMVELGKAREKFPQWPDDIIHAAMIVQEESGELGQAALQATYEPNKSSFDNAYTEAIQTAAMAIRFMQNIAHYVPSHRKQHRDDGHEQ